MKLYLSKDHIWTGTQADAKAAQGGNDFETVEVPDDKPSRIRWLNEQWGIFHQLRAVAETAVEAIEARPAPESPPPPPAPVQAPIAPPAGSVPEQIMELEGSALLNALQAAIERLHETAGPEGWKAFATHSKSWSGSTGVATDRGLGMLVLSGLAQLA